MEVETQRVDPLRSNFKPVNHHKLYKAHRDIIFEFKVIYMRLINIPLDMQSCINIIFPSRDPHSSLQINGLKITPCEKILKPLTRHRADTLMSEFYYVNTDRMKFKGSFLPFEVQIIQRWSDSLVLVSGVLRRKGDGWVLECKENKISNNGGLVDVYFAGRSFGMPLLLNHVVQFKRLKELDCIPEDSVIEVDVDAAVIYDKSEELKKSDSTKEFREELSEPLYEGEEELIVEEEQVSWFNAGVRVGIGLGFGMSLGVGVGLGLIMRTYKASSSIFKRFIV
ncbi:hypothetical protein GIB67_008953 [Kingdonia uniflora]|uniref:Uncharacterized protein n=1 Tax=Kingdonia uniflora TaxID=39325 RepID=A0A7J7LVQ5_9MAGN|nr:hypothetical protein GIB67_008953 [Kingdonia uniflora]